jgi:hypothetical protein
VNPERARRLLTQAQTATGRVRRNLFVAAAVSDAIANRPVLVGGAAEDHYIGGRYRQTDVDFVGWLTAEDEAALTDLGFHKEGRWWVDEGTGVPVEFPESSLAGDVERIRQIQVGEGLVSLIGPEDLYLDRVRQATAEPGEGQQTNAALALAITNPDTIDWRYIERVLDREDDRDPYVGSRMKKIHRRLRGRMRQMIDRGEI